MSTSVDQKIGQALKLARVEARLKQQDLAKALHVTGTYLSLIEGGHRSPSLTLLKKYAQVLDISLGYYLWLALDTEEASHGDYSAHAPRSAKRRKCQG
jgi:transcriptional regulator with XRE-family HTH domain